LEGEGLEEDILYTSAKPDFHTRIRHSWNCLFVGAEWVRSSRAKALTEASTITTPRKPPPFLHKQSRSVFLIMLLCSLAFGLYLFFFYYIKSLWTCRQNTE